MWFALCPAAVTEGVICGLNGLVHIIQTRGAQATHDFTVGWISGLGFIPAAQSSLTSDEQGQQFFAIGVKRAHTFLSQRVISKNQATDVVAGIWSSLFTGGPENVVLKLPMERMSISSRKGPFLFQAAANCAGNSSRF